MLDPRIVGLRAIAETLGTSTFQVLRWASTEAPSRPLTERYRDPLRLRSIHDALFIRRTRLTAWRNRNQRRGTGEKRVYGWTDICAFTGMRRTLAMEACEWAHDPLPVVRVEGERVWSYESALLDWCEAHEYAYGVHRLVSEARKLRGAEPDKRRWRKRAGSAEPGATGTARVGVAHVPEEYRSQDESAASSGAPQRRVSGKSRRSMFPSRQYDESGIRRAEGSR